MLLLLRQPKLLRQGHPVLRILKLGAEMKELSESFPMSQPIKKDFKK